MPKKKTNSTKLSDRVTEYAKAVVSGKVVAGPHVRAACKRHLKDLTRRNIRFELDAAEKAFRFFEKVLHLNGGQFEGRPFLLHPSQAFIVGSLFGWKRLDGTRRFRRAYIEQGKGNGKSPLVAGIGLYGMMVDDEPRAEIYAAASKKDQAMVMFRDAVAMVDQSPGLNKRIQRSGGNPVWNLAYLERGSFFRPISSEKGQSGPRPHFALCDEVHEHANRDTLEMLERGFKFRRQPLLVLITNSGFDKTTVCGEEHDHAVKVAHGEVEDDNTFSYVCALDDGDDPLENPECWVKANPLLGVTITEKYLSDVVAQAKAIPGKRNNILRLHFCVWTDADSAWIGKETWLACEADVDIEEMRCRVCYGGLDLSQKRDLTAFAVVCPTPDGKFDAFVEFWTPGDTIKEREDIDRVPYRVWKDEGHLTAVPGKAVDYGFVAHRLGELSGEYEILSVAYDRWQIDLLRKELDAEGVDLKLVECGQGFRDMSKALDALEDAILNGKLRVKTNPVLRWNAACTTLQTDAAGNRKFTKQKSIGRIDGIVALAMAMKAAVECENPRSVYEERGIITL